MSYTIIYPNSSGAVDLTSTQKISIQSYGSTAQVYQVVGFPNGPERTEFLGNVSNTETVFGTYSGGATLNIYAGQTPVFYSVGTDPVVGNDGDWDIEPAPTALNATGTLTAAMIFGSTVTSTTAAAVTATLDTGAVMEAASSWATSDVVYWSVINTGGSNAFTVTASTGHTVVGVAAVSALTSARFKTRRVSSEVFVTYRVS